MYIHTRMMMHTYLRAAARGAEGPEPAVKEPYTL